MKLNVTLAYILVPTLALYLVSLSLGKPFLYPSFHFFVYFIYSANQEKNLVKIRIF